MLGRTRLEPLPRRRRGVLTVWLCLVAGLSVLALACAGASWGGSGYDPAADVNSMYTTTLYTGAQAWWNAGYTGKGVDVALIDTGVSPVAGLDAPGKLDLRARPLARVAGAEPDATSTPTATARSWPA